MDKQEGIKRAQTIGVSLIFAATLLLQVCNKEQVPTGTDRDQIVGTSR